MVTFLSAGSDIYWQPVAWLQRLRQTRSSLQAQMSLFDYAGSHPPRFICRKLGLLVSVGHDRQPVSKVVQPVIRVAFDPTELNIGKGHQRPDPLYFIKAPQR